MSAFIVYPAIDIRDGKCVRLVQGDYNRETVYNDNPLEVALQWQEQGGEWIHTVDLDGAKAGHPVNYELIGRIAKAVRVPVQTGGGLRTEEDVDRLLSLGVSRVILGTAAIENRAFVHEVLRKHGGDKVAIGLDCRGGYVATRGWLETTEVLAADLARELAEYGARTFIFTDIARDGMMGGPNVEAIVQLAQASKQTVIASGGISRFEDLAALAKHAPEGVGGAIVGKALYTGSIVLKRRWSELGRSR
ncbi:1-(5-phosphoribosyl)-5-[(5-phosphoribosylamino)methylideneamino] imidazole-4-carboxamide isomerase [Gordoniibacillus kamchatkensis]|uniref:1-(5-phosphoribosyl)-5-[(5-phosphoribosylamino)methylideneamino] imidazole-4-carboxamide isomerase n=1 Tax=Gordoniibacillus kamchatkensis TaxID=1590651 RepID=A0ABR5AD58_9BACL|nr:1-(5-phosphoribosyl)-5-[(5-phosphoribosylamino)methylideneamino]imidazole-4-carboxamide isomerase [Paenibacillus sp. VKM B-2647]KIL38827.1 1-(5-phosphoribosyl)-5-[(5-phosphoribosylamino)methylideneamino] imidazole-4-carboxamide isomerase [Paenibacillus sp. VKM B-2647]